MIIRQSFEEILNHYNSLKDYYSEIINDSPDGSLQHQINHGKHQFIKYCNSNGNKTRTVITKDESMIRRLAQKEFAGRSLEIIEKNLQAIKDLDERITDFDPDEILKSMSKAYALLPEEYFFNRNRLNTMHGLERSAEARIRRHQDWGRQSYKEYWGHPENKTKRSSRGQYVRSKSELLIIESLYKYSIPFHYEEELEIQGRSYAPDFKFMDFNFSPFYWEHLGMMDVPSYARKNLIKLEEYYEIGLVPGDNLILTFDRRNDIDMALIDAIIKNELIPRL